MKNPFAPTTHPNPYRWTPFALTGVPRNQWNSRIVREWIDAAIVTAGGKKPAAVDGVVVTEAAVNAMRGAFDDPNSRLVSELLVHPTHEREDDRYAAEIADIRGLVEKPRGAEWSLRLRPTALSHLLCDWVPRASAVVITAPRPGRSGPRSSDATLAFAIEGLR